MDPKLAARFKKQQEKEEKGDELEVAEIGSAAKEAKQLDPKLAALWAKQAEMQDAKVEAMDEIGSAATKERQLDPVLAKRWSKLESSAVEIREVGSTATVSTQQLDPKLAKRWAKQQEDEAAGRTWDSPEKPEPAEGGEEGAAAVAPELAAQFAKYRQKPDSDEAGGDSTAAAAAAGDGGEGGAEREDGRGGGGGEAEAAPPRREAAREHLAVRAGRDCEHSITWPQELAAARVHWSAVVLDGLNIDLEVIAVLRPSDAAASAEVITLQRHARGETFVAEFCPSRDRRCLLSTGEGAGDAAQAGASEEPPRRAFREVEKLVFKFSNSFSWLTAKDVELVTLFE